MIPWHYQQLAREVHQERIRAALTPRPERAPRMRLRSAEQSSALRPPFRRLARWLTFPIPRGDAPSRTEEATRA
jgi:hypothetical protein